MNFSQVIYDDLIYTDWDWIHLLIKDLEIFNSNYLREDSF